MAFSTTAFPFTSEVTYDSAGWPTLDRAVDSTVLRNMIKKYFSDGLFLSADSTAWKVTAPSDSSQTVVVAAGCGLIQGATGYTESSNTLDMPDADTSLPRYDMVVARLNDNSDYRNIYIDIIEGTAASSPAYPDLTQSDSIWEIGLAALYRPANSTTITQSQITDLRADSTYAGQVNAIDSIDTSDWADQLNAYYAEFVEQCETDYADYTAQCAEIIADLATYEGEMETEFTTWFEEMKDQLSEDAAGALQLEIDEAAELNFNRFYGLVNRTVAFTRNDDGSLATCTATNSDESVTAVTTFNRNDDGSIASVVTVVTPSSGSYYYTQTSTFTRNSDGSLASITEAYTSTHS